MTTLTTTDPEPTGLTSSLRAAVSGSSAGLPAARSTAFRDRARLAATTWSTSACVTVPTSSAAVDLASTLWPCACTWLASEPSRSKRR